MPPQLACPRYFGNAVAEAVVREVEIAWRGPKISLYRSKTTPVSIGRLSLTETPATRLINAVGGVLPDALWRREAVLKPMGKAASLVLRAGRLGLADRVPNRQRFIANPRLI